MPSFSNRFSSRTLTALVSLTPIFVLAALLVFLPPDGGERATWAQFLGRFHLLLVHFPIALILLVAAMEFAGRNPRYSYLRTSVPFILTLAFIGVTASAFLGWDLARSGGYSGPLLTQHMWGAAALAILCWLCCVLRNRGGRFETFYCFALAASLGLVTWTGYRGGQLSQGENHLTEFMPHSLRWIFRVSTETGLDQANDDTFYGARIQPIFASQCLPCHGREKRKGGLQLDSYAALMRGGKDGAAIKAGDLRGSDLYRRITLSPGDDNFMPKGGRPALTEDQVKLIELWIANGASSTAKLDSIKDVPNASPVVREVTFAKPNMAEVERGRAEIASALASLQQRFPNVLEYESRGSADLVLNASLLANAFKDDDVKAFAPVSSHIVVADFSRTGITDKSSSFIAGLKHIRILRLAHTHVGDVTLQSIAGLEQLSSLNIFDTAVTPAALPVLEKMHSLRICYAGQTAIADSHTVPSNIAAKLVF
jgi:uncharacterized membrane protein/mono/diheme cytochrome c family protein